MINDNGGINIKNQKKMLSIAVISMMLVSLFVAVVPMTVAVPNPCTVRGYVYVDGIITTPDQITLTFPEQEISAYIPGDPVGYYIIDFSEEVKETGIFAVVISGISYTTSPESITIQSGVYLYKINLTVNTPPNNPPDKPTNPSPKNNSKDIDLNPTLSVYVTDPDEGTMNVSFYNASDDSLIDVDTDVTNGSTASVDWPDLSYNTIYYWYAIANDSQLETRSDTWQFTTKKAPIEPPTVEITKPICRSIYFRNTRIPRLLPRILIIGWIDIEVNAIDNEGVSKVEFYIDNELKHTDYEKPYNWIWNERAFFRHTIKVIAYDTEDAEAQDSIDVFVINFRVG